MRIFICARKNGADSARKAGQLLTDAGHEIYSTWISARRGSTNTKSMASGSADLLSEQAMQDFRDLVKSDCVVALVPNNMQNASNTKDEIFGAGVAFNKRMVVIGRRVNAFHYLPMVEHYGTLQAFIDQLESE